MIDYSQQVSIFDPDNFYEPVHVIGAGGIGSALFFPLSKLGVSELHVWDTDTLELKNIPYQLPYRPSDVGRSKVELLAEFAQRQELDCDVTVHNQRVDDNTELDGVVFSGVDSMESRKAIWHTVQSQRDLVPLYIDGRIGGEYVQMFSVNPQDSHQCAVYESWLFDDEHAAPLPCSARAVIHPAGLLANLMIAEFTRWYRKEPLKGSVFVDLKSIHFS